MATPAYDQLQNKVLQYCNRDKEIFGNPNRPGDWRNYIGDFLRYGADECYRLLRIPPLEFERNYTVEQADIVGSPNISVIGTNNWAGTGGISYVKIPIPSDFTDLKSLRINALPSASGTYQNYATNGGIVFNEQTDERTFFDVYAETYSNFYFMRKDNYFYVKPALAAGTQVAISYYRQLPALDADYSVVAQNYLFDTTATPNKPAGWQPFLNEKPVQTTYIVGAFNPEYPNYLGIVPTIDLEVGDLLQINSSNFEGQVKVVSLISNTQVAVDNVFSLDNYPVGATAIKTPQLYFICGSTSGTNNWFRVQAFDDQATFDAAVLPEVLGYKFTKVYASTAGTASSPLVYGYFEGYELSNWLKDQNEYLLLWSALKHAGSFLDDEKVEARYEKKFMEVVFALNNEEKMRRARGGNVQVHFNARGLI